MPKSLVGCSCGPSNSMSAFLIRRRDVSSGVSVDMSGMMSVWPIISSIGPVPQGRSSVPPPNSPTELACVGKFLERRSAVAKIGLSPGA